MSFRRSTKYHTSQEAAIQQNQFYSKFLGIVGETKRSIRRMTSFGCVVLLILNLLAQTHGGSMAKQWLTYPAALAAGGSLRAVATSW